MLHAGADRGRGFGRRVVAQLFERDGGHFDVDIDAVEQRPGYLAQIALNDGRRAAAFAAGVAVEAAGARVQITTPTGYETGVPLKRKRCAALVNVAALS